MPELAFAINDRVNIKAHGISGVVNAVWIGRASVSYNVEYADNNGTICDRYFDASEIEKT